MNEQDFYRMIIILYSTLNKLTYKQIAEQISINTSLFYKWIKKERNLGKENFAKVQEYIVQCCVRYGD